ncbi:MAG: protein kinase, partial [Planctomycetes bacterium]|nr:protein kinase [Planctomycetota bacterium]
MTSAPIPDRSGQALIDRAKDLFCELIELDGQERLALLDARCAADDALRHAVAGLLEAHDAAGDFLREPPPRAPGSGSAPTAHLPLPTGSRVGAYVLESVLGDGGFGVVYLARQEEPIRRQVAFKVLKLGMDTALVARRFEVERETLALMDHPGIARVLDAGTTPRGRSFFVMEFVDGDRITDFCDRQRLDLRARLSLFERVCFAVQHAHQKGVIHRDLKPSNVLVTMIDGVAVPKVIDFGIAKAVGGRLAEHTLTGDRQIVGTPEYMAPEQTMPAERGERGEQDVDTRADVYSLGIILYHLLVGQSPYRSTTFDPKSPDAWRTAIQHGDLPRPSSLVGQAGDEAVRIAADRRTTPDRLARSLRRELDWIVLRAIERDRTRRYQSASALADDVRRFLFDQPVEAGPPSTRYRLAKFCRRNRAAVAVFALTVVTAIVSIYAAIESDRLRGIAERQAYVANVFAAEVALQESDSIGARRRLDATPVELRGWEWHHFDSRVDVSETALQPAGRDATMARFSPDGAWIAVGWHDGTVDIVAAGEVIPEAHGSGFGEWVRSLCWSADGSALFVALQSGEFVRWQWREGIVTKVTGHEQAIVEVAILPATGELVSASLDGAVRIYDAATLSPRQVFRHGAQLSRLAISPDSATLVSIGWDQQLMVWDRVTGARRGVAGAARESTAIVPPERFPPGQITEIAFAPDSRSFVTACRDGLAVVWNAADVTRRGTIEVHRDVVRDVAWSPGGSRIALACRDATATLWDAETLELVAMLDHEADVRTVAFGPDGRLLATSSWDRSVRLFDATVGTAIDVMLGHGDGVYAAEFSPDGSRLLSWSLDHSVRTWIRPRTIGLLRRHASGIYALACGPGTMLATAEVSGSAFLWDTDRPTPVKGPLAQRPGIEALALSPDGALLATGTEDGGLRLWNTTTCDVLRDLTGHTAFVVSIAFDARGERIAAGTRDGTIRVWNVASGEVDCTLTGHGGDVTDLAFAPDGIELLSSGMDGTVRRWNPTTGVELQ